MQSWPQVYNPLHSAFWSTVVAAIPIVVLLGTIALFRVRAHVAALLGLAAALAVAIGVLGMPGGLAARATLLGAAYGLLPIGWIILNVIFLYQLTMRRGLFDVLRASLARVTGDRRLQLLLVAFCFGSFFEGAAGFGTPVAITSALLLGLGFAPLEASGLSLIANTAPVAFGALGTPLVALAAVTGLPLLALSGTVGRQLAIFAMLIPFWLLLTYAGVKRTRAIWPAVLIAAVAFAVPEWLISSWHGPWLVNIVASVVSAAAVLAFMRVWRPSDVREERRAEAQDGEGERRATRAEILRAWVPWLILSVVVFAWGLPQVKGVLDGFSKPTFVIHGLDGRVLRVPPVVAHSTPEAATYVFNWLSATGTSILVAALLGAAAMGYKPREIVREYWDAFKVVKLSLLTIAAMLAIGYLTRYAGLDAILGLAFARTGHWYPFFGTLLGWLGTALTGSDTSSNVLFGSLQQITAQHVGVSATLMAAANSSGGVMGKMIDMQSIVVASTTTRWYGHESEILRFVFFHSLALAALVGGFVALEAYVAPFTHLVVR